MNKPNIFVWILLLIFLIGTLVWGVSYVGSNKSTGAEVYVSSKWNQDFNLNNKDALGLYIFRSMVRSKLDSADVALNDTLILPKNKTTFICIGDKIALTNSELNSLIDEVQKGSHLFLSFHYLTENIYNYLFNNSPNHFVYDEQLTIHSKNSNYTFSSIYQADTLSRKWNFFNQNFIEISPIKRLTSAYGYTNFVEIELGNGKVFLHANPEFFYNYQLLSKDGFNHALFVIDLLPKSYKINWLELAKLNDDYLNSEGEENIGEGKIDINLLQFIFQNKTLTLAFILTIVCILIFLAFKTKRILPYIPFYPKEKNRTTDFVETIKEIYLQQRSPFTILVVMKNNLISAINKHFFIDFSKELSSEKTTALAEKTNYPIEKLKSLLAFLQLEENESITNELIENFAKKQREFYIHSGIISKKLHEKMLKKEMIFKRKIALPSILLFSGIILILTALFLLSKANGFGVLFIPAGISCLFVSILLFSRPILRITSEAIIYTPLFGKSKKKHLSELAKIDSSKNSSSFIFHGNYRFTIHHRELHAFDLVRFIAFKNELKRKSTL
jgi:hypothetical protein